MPEYRHGVKAPANPSGSNLASGPMGFTATVGRGSLEVTSGHGMAHSGGVEHTSAPTTDAATGLTFTTEAGLPVPGGNPRPHDLVEIGGMQVKVAQAVRDGLIPDPAKVALAHPHSAPYSGHNAVSQGNPRAAQSAAVAAPESAAGDAADSFTAEVLPRVSPATIASLEADLNEGHFSEKTLDYLMLEGGQSAAELRAVRDAYAAKVTAATGMNEAELQELWQDNRPRLQCCYFRDAEDRQHRRLPSPSSTGRCRSMDPTGHRRRHLRMEVPGLPASTDRRWP